MAGAVPIIPRLKFFDTAGNPLALGWVTVYLAGTTTPATTYQDMGLTVPNTNPVHLDANGEGLFYVDPTLRYKLLLQNAALVTVSGWPVDNVLSAGNMPGTLIGVQTFTSTGAYTPTPGTTSIIVELVGGGGAGGGTLATGAGQIAAGAGGSAGGYARSRLTSGLTGNTVTIGAGGVAALGGAGGNGGTTSFGVVFSATGGNGGAVGNVSAATVTTFNQPGAAGAGVNGNIISSAGQPGLPGLYTDSGAALGGSGGCSVFGGGGVGLQTNNGNNAASYGGGGSGAASVASTAARIGGNGGPGVCIILEYA